MRNMSNKKANELIDLTEKEQDANDDHGEAIEVIDLTGTRTKRVREEDDINDEGEVDEFDLSEVIHRMMPTCSVCYKNILPPLKIFKCEKCEKTICGSCCEKSVKCVCGQDSSDMSGMKRNFRFEEGSKKAIKYEIMRKVDQFLEKENKKKKIILNIKF